MPLSKIVQNSVDTPVAGTGPAFSFGQSVSQNCSSGVATKLTFTSSDFDTTGGMFVSSRFTPTVAGYYQITAAVQTTNTATASSSQYIYIYKNGSSFKQAQYSCVNAATQTPAFISGLVYCNGSTDYIEIYLNQFGVATAGTSAQTDRTYFQGVLVRAA